MFTGMLNLGFAFINLVLQDHQKSIKLKKSIQPKFCVPLVKFGHHNCGYRQQWNGQTGTCDCHFLQGLSGGQFRGAHHLFLLVYNLDAFVQLVQPHQDHVQCGGGHHSRLLTLIVKQVSQPFKRTRIFTKGITRCIIALTFGLKMVVLRRNQFKPSDMETAAVTAHA